MTDFFKKYKSSENEKLLSLYRKKSVEYIKSLSITKKSIVNFYTVNSQVLNMSLMNGTVSITTASKISVLTQLFKIIGGITYINIITQNYKMDTSNKTIDLIKNMKLYTPEMIDNLFIKYISLITLTLQTVIQNAPRLDGDELIITKGTRKYSEIPNSVNKRVSNKQYLFNSASGKLQTAVDFAGNDCCVMFLRYKKGDPVFHISSISQYGDDEDEFLLPFGIFFDFVGKSMVRKKTSYDIELTYPKNTTDISMWGKHVKYNPWLIKYNWKENATTDDYFPETFALYRSKEHILADRKYKSKKLFDEPNKNNVMKIVYDRSGTSGVSSEVFSDNPSDEKPDDPTILEEAVGMRLNDSTIQAEQFYKKNDVLKSIPFIPLEKRKIIFSTKWKKDMQKVIDTIPSKFKTGHSTYPLGSGLDWKKKGKYWVVKDKDDNELVFKQKSSLTELLDIDIVINKIANMFPQTFYSSNEVKHCIQDDNGMISCYDKNNNKIEFIIKQTNTSTSGTSCNPNLANAKSRKHICNPATGKWVLKTGAVGKKIVNSSYGTSPPSQTNTSTSGKSCNPNLANAKSTKHICNPATGKWVLKTGVVGKKILSGK